jgi:hypothetical protein
MRDCGNKWTVGKELKALFFDTYSQVLCPPISDAIICRTQGQSSICPDSLSFDFGKDYAAKNPSKALSPENFAKPIS